MQEKGSDNFGKFINIKPKNRTHTRDIFYIIWLHSQTNALLPIIYVCRYTFRAHIYNNNDEHFGIIVTIKLPGAK